MANPSAAMSGTGGFRRTLAGFVALLVLQTASAFGAGTWPRSSPAFHGAPVLDSPMRRLAARGGVYQMVRACACARMWGRGLAVRFSLSFLPCGGCAESGMVLAASSYSLCGMYVCGAQAELSSRQDVFRSRSDPGARRLV